MTQTETVSTRITLTSSIADLLAMLKACNDGGVVVRSSADGLRKVRSKTGITIHEDGTGWCSGLRFENMNELTTILKWRSDPDFETNDLPQRCPDCGVVTARCLCK